MAIVNVDKGGGRKGIPKMPYMSWRNSTVFYTDTFQKAINKPALLCLHGSGGHGRHWAYQIKWAKRHGIRLIAVDMPGHSKSGQYSYLNTIEDYTDFVEEFLEFLNISSFGLLGHSMGSFIALEVCMRQNMAPEFAVFAGMPVKFQIPDWLRHSLHKGIIPFRFVESLYHEQNNAYLASAFDEIKGVSAALMLNNLYACQLYMGEKGIANIVEHLTIPAYFISGEQDPFATPDIPLSHFNIIDEAGHMVMIEQPEHFNSLLYQILCNHEFV